MFDKCTIFLLALMQLLFSQLQVTNILYRSDHQDRFSGVIKSDLGLFMHYTLRAIRENDPMFDVVWLVFIQGLINSFRDQLPVFRMDGIQKGIICCTKLLRLQAEYSIHFV